MASLEQVSMSYGEISPQAYDRVDLQWWVSALKTCRNFMTTPYGGVKNRPGTKLVAEVKSSALATRLLPFQFSVTQSYAIEVGDGYMRFHTNGGTVLYSTWTPWVTTTAYKIGDRVSSGGNNYRCLAGHTSGTFATDLAAGYWVLVGAIGDEVEVVSPYAAADLATLQITQSADVMTIVHPDYMPYNLSRYDNDLWTLTPVAYTSGPWQEMNADINHTMVCNKEEGDAATITSSKAFFTSDHIGQLIYLEQRHYGKPWEPGKEITAGDIRRSDGKYYKATNTGISGQLRPTHFTDVWSDGTIEWEYLHNGYGVAKITAVAANGLTCTVDILSRMPKDAAITAAGTQKSVSSIAKDPSTGYTRIALSTSHGFPSTGIVDVAYTYFYNIGLGVGVKQVVGTYSYTTYNATTIIIPVKLNETATSVSGTVTLVSSEAVVVSNSYRWKLGAWDGDQGFPSTVTYHQGRRVYASTPAQPQVVWASRVDSYEDFSTTSPIADDDALTFRVVGSQVNNIMGLLSMDQLVILTSASECVLGSSASEIITPGNIQVRTQSFYGSADLQPIGVGDVTLFVQNKGQLVRDLSYSFAENRFNGISVSALSQHLLEGKQVVRWAFQQHPNSTIWMVLDDGSVLGLTYMRDQKVVGWHRHEFGDPVEDVVCVSEGDEDAVYFMVKRAVTIDGVASQVRYVERMHTREITTIEDSVFLDCSLSATAVVRAYDDDTVHGQSRLTAKMTIYRDTGYSPQPADNLKWTPSDPALRIGALTTAESGFTDFFTEADIARSMVLRSGTDAVGVTIEQQTGTPVWPALNARVTALGTIPESLRDTVVQPADWDWGMITIGGLGHLGARSVMILGDGVPYGPFTVDSLDPEITLTVPVVKALAGLAYTSEIETLSLKSNATNETISNKKKTICGVFVKALEGNSIKAGRDLDNLYEEPLSGTPETQLTGGLLQLHFPTPWGTDGSMVIQQDKPLPLTITSIMPEVEIGGV